MRNLLLILLLANILYFLWGWLSPDSLQPGVEVVDESTLGPPLTVTEAPEADVVASVGAVLGSGEPSDLAAVVGRSCATIGPFRDSNDADEAQMVYADAGMRVGRRTAQGQVFVGHWVQVRNIPSREEANRMLGVLREGGIPEAYIIETDDEGIKISLGLFTPLDVAERFELQSESLGIPAEITIRSRDGTVHFVDVALPPGTGAADIVDRYGEDRVALRDDATCPQAS